MSWRSYVQRHLLDGFGGNQRAMARSLDRSAEEVNRWLNQGRVPRLETQYSIIELLGDRWPDVCAEVEERESISERAILNDTSMTVAQRHAIVDYLRRVRTGQERVPPLHRRQTA